MAGAKKKGKRPNHPQYTPSHLKDTESRNEIAMTLQGINAAVLSCLESGDHSDLIIKCNGREFKAHKFALCPQSDYFTNAMKRNAFHEGHTGVILMDHDGPDAISAMLRYLYTGDYNTEGQTMQFHLKIYELADGVRIPTLKTLSEDEFKVMAEKDWNHPLFHAYVKTAYEITPPGSGGASLRSIVVEIAAEHVKDLFKLETGFRHMMEDVAAFGADLSEVLGGVRSSKLCVSSMAQSTFAPIVFMNTSQSHVQPVNATAQIVAINASKFESYGRIKAWPKGV